MRPGKKYICDDEVQNLRVEHRIIPLAQLESAMMNRAMRVAKNNKSLAARLLRITRARMRNVSNVTLP